MLDRHHADRDGPDKPGHDACAPESGSPRRFAPGAPRVAIFTDKMDWHIQSIAAALARQGARPVPVRLEACRIDTRSASGLVLPGFRARLPDAALVRAIGDGTLEAVTLRLGVLHALEALGVPVVNSARAIERCTDKSMASFLVKAAGLKTPDTFVAQSLQEARAFARRECGGGPLVLKPLFGAQGWGLKLIFREEDLPTLEEARGVFYLQRFVKPRGKLFEDTRALVSRGKIVGAMRRRSPQWITNVRQGAQPVGVELSALEAETALGAAAALGADLAGVDIIAGADGAPQVLEVNSMPGWSGLQRVTRLSVADRLAADALAGVAALRRAHG
jgi:tetrahydromethanopterin:alpha-L-glutamate ligase